MSFKKLEFTFKGLSVLRGTIKRALVQFKKNMTAADRRSLKAMLSMATRPESRLKSPKWFATKVKRLNPLPYKTILMQFFDPTDRTRFKSYDAKKEYKAAKKTGALYRGTARKNLEQRKRLKTQRENLPQKVIYGVTEIKNIPTDVAVRNVRSYGSRMRDSSYGPMKGTPRTLIRGFSNSLRNPNLIKKEESRNKLTSSTSRAKGKKIQLSTYRTPTRNSNTTASSTDVRNVFARASDNAGSGYRYNIPVSPIPLSTPARGLIHRTVEGVKLLNEF